MALTYELANKLSPDIVLALAKRLILEHTVNSTADSLRNDPNYDLLWRTAKHFNIPVSFLTKGMEGTLALALEVIRLREKE